MLICDVRLHELKICQVERRIASTVFLIHAYISIIYFTFFRAYHCSYVTSRPHELKCDKLRGLLCGSAVVCQRLCGSARLQPSAPRLETSFSKLPRKGWKQCTNLRRRYIVFRRREMLPHWPFNFLGMSLLPSLFSFHEGLVEKFLLFIGVSKCVTSWNCPSLITNVTEDVEVWR